ncbi:hypothetical protein F2Q70_00003349 [Brassica cretica]|uniref:Uncharacterized protein n=1 Tax=Brassica cretica TaxID=69181 RepID=A0A8S9IR98_BRACR|nr:hypothetical protein F2Q70_00003349 [Brassica cretica]
MAPPLFPLPPVPRCDEPEAVRYSERDNQGVVRRSVDFLLLLGREVAWLMPLISEPPEMTCITRSCRGGETGVASVGLPVVSLLRWLLALSKRNSLRCPFLSSSLTSIFSATQSSVL